MHASPDAVILHDFSPAKAPEKGLFSLLQGYYSISHPKLQQKISTQLKRVLTIPVVPLPYLFLQYFPTNAAALSYSPSGMRSTMGAQWGVW